MGPAGSMLTKFRESGRRTRATTRGGRRSVGGSVVRRNDCMILVSMRV